MAGKYKTLKALAEAHDVNYGYIKKRAASWKKEKAVIEDLSNEISFVEEQERQAIMYDLSTIPEDREAWHRRLWDKLGLAAERALDNPDENFYTHDGKLKSKALADVAAVLDKVQRGQSEMKENKATGQLESYANLIAGYRKQVEVQTEE